jgi:hypothetical protein
VEGPISEGPISLRPTGLIVLGRVVVAVAPCVACNGSDVSDFAASASGDDAIVKGLHHARFHVIIRFTVSHADATERHRFRSAACRGSGQCRTTGIDLRGSRPEFKQLTRTGRNVHRASVGDV